MNQNNCDHESETHITLTPVSIEYEFRCKKCGIKKYKSVPIVPFWLADTGRARKRKWWQL